MESVETFIFGRAYATDETIHFLETRVYNILNLHDRSDIHM